MQQLDNNNKVSSITLIYATQTGTSYDLAKSFYLTYHQKINISKFLNIQQLTQLPQSQQNLSIFFISTTGQGDFPYSMRILWKRMLLKSFPKLFYMKFTIFAFGDRSYGQNFCLAARKFRQRLIGLGAEEVIEIGLGDQQEANGYLQEYRDKWLVNFMNYMQKNDGLYLNKGNKQINKQVNNLLETTMFSNNNKNTFYMTIIDRKQICSNKNRRAFTIDVQISDNYKQTIVLGDILSIYPYNNPSDVQYLMAFFNLSNDQIFQPLKIPYFQLFTQSLNVSSTLNQSFFICRPDLFNLSSYCSNQLYRSKLIQLQTDYDQYHNYIKKYKRNVVEVLKDFQIEKLPVDDFIKRCNMLVSRKYSISQVIKNKDKNNQKICVRILFRLVNDKINQNRIHKGLCSHDLAIYANINDRRKVNVLKGEFQYNEKKQNHLICISLGTGIAPFIQFMDMASKSQNMWNLNIFYTNRHSNQVYFQQHLQLLSQFNKLNPFLSFTGQGGKRIIRLVEDNIQQIHRIIQQSNNQFRIMICGPKEVCEGVENILEKGLGVDMKVLKKKKILMYENW